MKDLMWDVTIWCYRLLSQDPFEILVPQEHARLQGCTQMNVGLGPGDALVSLLESDPTCCLR